MLAKRIEVSLSLSLFKDGFFPSALLMQVESWRSLWFPQHRQTLLGHVLLYVLFPLLKLPFSYPEAPAQLSGHSSELLLLLCVPTALLSDAPALGSHLRISH